MDQLDLFGYQVTLSTDFQYHWTGRDPI